ncbi:integrase catalytic domain-containing protein [Trichonephila clavipes]|nr:integrase catalytic domain-containing protein [Trichonephila clavipes]
MGDLPKDRVTLKRPFYCCGIDYAGPVSVLKYRGRGAKTTKGYIVIFVCFATKALHLELVSDYTSETFIAALKRFCSRRSTPKHIHSDNGTNFIGAKRKLGELFKHLSKITNEEKVCYFLSQQEIEWHTIPSLSPHVGGLWEAGVKSIKFHLKRVVVGEEIIGPPETVEESKLALKGRWDIVQKLKLNFWKRWQIDYLNSIQGRTKWKSGTSNIKIGDVVIIKEENLPPSVWPLGKVISTHPVCETRSKTETQELVLNYFRETLDQDSTGRYKVNLPWLEGHPPLPDNKELAQKRLKNTVKSVKLANLLNEYQEVFNQWEREGIIEPIHGENDIPENLEVHYLPHRAVFKDNSTTKVRPVFDGSAKMRNFVSINECIEKGPNLIEMIPAILNRFRWGKNRSYCRYKTGIFTNSPKRVGRRFF